MLQRTTRAFLPLPALTRRTALRAYSHVSDHPIPANDPNPSRPNVRDSTTSNLPTSPEGSQDATLQESLEAGEEKRIAQAPNRATTWSRSQKPRAEAMVGPRFEQTIMEDQPRPFAAIELIHKQPVRWTTSRIVSCDGGGGPLGHPRIFINADKPQICWCTYCGVPYAHEQHRKYLESLPRTTYPLAPTSDPAAVPYSQLAGKTGSTEPLQSNSGAPLEQR